MNDSDGTVIQNAIHIAESFNDWGIETLEQYVEATLAVVITGKHDFHREAAMDIHKKLKRELERRKMDAAIEEVLNG